MIELRWLLPAEDQGRTELRRLQEVASKLAPPGIIEPRPHGRFIAIHTRVTTPEDVAKLAAVADEFSTPGCQAVDRVQTSWFQCEILQEKRQAQRIEWVREIALSLGNVGEVHFSTAVSQGSTFADVLYSGSEDPRLVLTKLYLATGESFRLHRTWTSKRANFVRPVSS